MSIYLGRIDKSKKNGSTAPIPVHASNLMLKKVGSRSRLHNATPFFTCFETHAFLFHVAVILLISSFCHLLLSLRFFASAPFFFFCLLLSVLFLHFRYCSRVPRISPCPSSLPSRLTLPSSSAHQDRPRQVPRGFEGTVLSRAFHLCTIVNSPGAGAQLAQAKEGLLQGQGKEHDRGQSFFVV
jgi:hypothetical protein